MPKVHRNAVLADWLGHKKKKEKHQIFIRHSVLSLSFSCISHRVSLMFSSKEGFSSGKKKSFVDHLFDVKRLLLLYWGGGGGGVRGGGCHSKIVLF